MSEVAASRDMTQDELRIARHTLGLDNPNANGVSFRNKFYASRGHTDWQTLHDMVGVGWMNLEDEPNGKQTLFWLNRWGAELALMPGEGLDREDFPPPKAAAQE